MEIGLSIFDIYGGYVCNHIRCIIDDHAWIGERVRSGDYVRGYGATELYGNAGVL